MASVASDMLEPVRAEIEAFLSEIGGGALQLHAITPDGPIVSQWFGDDAEAAAQWADRENRRGKNVYFTVNEAEPGNKKPSKADIHAVRFAHVDIDPPKDGRPFDPEAALARLQAADPSPNILIDSGNGVHAYWTVDGLNIDADTIEAINRGLCAEFGGDHCWNVDRIMRVAGTVNYPDRKKAAQGRAPRMCATIQANDGGSVSIDSLMLAYPEPPQSAPVAAERGDLMRGQDMGLIELLTPESLGLATLDPLRSVIEFPAGADRSRDVLRCAGDMARKGFSREQVLCVLLNPANAVADHIFDQSDPRRAALRVVEMAFSPNAEPPRSSGAEARQAAVNEAAQTVSAMPYVWREASAIPERPWIMGRWLLRRTLTGAIASGGGGKSTFIAAMSLSLATGRALLGKGVWPGPQRVWVWNLEDELDELARAIQAAALHYDIEPQDVGDRLFVNSAMDGEGLCTAVDDDRGFRLLEPVYEALAAELIRRGIDVLIVDPFVSSHEIDENANVLIDKIAKRWSRVAVAANCAIVLVHHTSKAGAGEVTVLSSRGAVALTNACRQVLLFNRMDEAAGERLGVDEADVWRLFSVEDGKRNRAPAERADWYRLASVDLGNGPAKALGGHGDSVGVAEPWTAPDPFANVTGSHLLRVQTAIDGGNWRESVQSPDWAGRAVAGVMGWDADNKADRARIGQLLRTWIAEGALKIEMRKDAKRMDRPFVAVARWQNDGSAPPAESEAGQGEAVGRLACHTTTPGVNRGVGQGAAGDVEQVGQGEGEAALAGIRRATWLPPAPHGNEALRATDKKAGG